MATAFQSVAFQTDFQQDSGDAGKKKRHPVYFVRVDGRERIAPSLSDALEMLSAAKTQAKKEAAQLVKTVSVKDRPILPKIRIPQVTASEPIRKAAAETQREIEQIYRSALQDLEIAMWLEVVKREETDEDSVLLLM